MKRVNRWAAVAVTLFSFAGAAYAQSSDAPVTGSQDQSLAAGPSEDHSLQAPGALGERSAKNSMFVELGGSGVMYSLNYERFFLQDAAVRVGAMYFGISSSATSGTTTDSASASWLAIPILAEYTGVRQGNHALELGVGIEPMHFSATASSDGTFGAANGWLMTGTAAIGYRYQNPAGGFLFRATFTPLFVFSPAQGGSAFVPWGGVSFGYSF